MHLQRSLGLIALTGATCASAFTPLGIISSAGEGVVRFGLRNVLRLNETSIDAILNRGESPLEPHPYARESRSTSQLGVAPRGAGTCRLIR